MPIANLSFVGSEHLLEFLSRAGGQNGREDTPIAPGDRVHVLPAITGG